MLSWPVGKPWESLYSGGPYGGEAAYAREDEKRFHWLPSMPVLHLAVALCEELYKFPNPASPYGYNDHILDGTRLIWNLVQYPQWLAKVLVRAEGYRSILPDRLPDGCGFDPTKALRLLQK